MSWTNSSSALVSIREKANTIIKSYPAATVEFTQEEKQLMKERFRIRFDLWKPAFDDMDSLDKEQMLVHLKRWIGEINSKQVTGWVLGPVDRMDIYPELEFNYCNRSIPYEKTFPANAAITFYEAIAEVLHCAELLEEALSEICVHSSFAPAFTSMTLILFDQYNSEKLHKNRNFRIKECRHVFDAWFFCLIDCMYYSLGGGQRHLSFGLSKVVDSAQFAASLKHFREAVKYGLAYVSIFPRIIFGYCCEREALDEQLRTHRLDGPALRFPEMKPRYFIKGVEVPEHVVLRPDKIKINDILNEPNQEVKSIMLERFGIDRFVSNSKATVIDSQKDEYGENQLLKIPLGGDETGYFACVICPSTSKKYILRVPPSKNVREAIAWTFGMFEDDYKPLKET